EVFTRTMAGTSISTSRGGSKPGGPRPTLAALEARLYSANARASIAAGIAGAPASHPRTAEDFTMARWRPAPTFYASPALAAEAPTETLAYVTMVAVDGGGKRDAIGVVDTAPDSPSYGRLVGQTD